jgi:hypothetical protein
LGPESDLSGGLRWRVITSSSDGEDDTCCPRCGRSSNSAGSAATPPRGSRPGSYWVVLSTAQLADGRGDQPRALEALCDGWTENEHSLGLRVYLAPELVRAALAAGNTELARSVADTVASYAPNANASSARGNALLARGLVDHDPELLAQAAAAFRSGGSPHDVAIACEATATAIATRSPGGRCSKKRSRHTNASARGATSAACSRRCAQPESGAAAAPSTARS